MLASSLYSYCQAWTFADASNCNDRLPGAPGCCYLKKATDWVATPSPGMVSGTTQGAPAASCTYEFDTDLAGGDILTADGSDTVVPTFSDADCCQSCASTPGCGAWTMTPPSNCEDALGRNIVGCCFLKYSSGWTQTEDPKGVKTSGVLLSSGRRRA